MAANFKAAWHLTLKNGLTLSKLAILVMPTKSGFKQY